MTPTSAAKARALHMRVRDIQERATARLVAFGVVLALGIVVGTGALVLFAKVADEVMEHETVVFDIAAFRWVRQFGSPATDMLMQGVSLMGAQLLAGVVLVVFAVLAVRRRWANAALLLLVVFGAQILNTLLKATFQRERPMAYLELLPAQQFSFPSGHTMLATAVYLYLAYLSWQHLRGFARYALPVSAVLLILLVGVSRVYLEMHYATDVIAGFIAGFIWLDTVIIASRFLDSRRQRRVGQRGHVVPRTA
jgi:membrane-associated phospholipid phosphatase